MALPRKVVLASSVFFVAAVTAIAMNSQPVQDPVACDGGVDVLSIFLDCGNPPRKPCGKLATCGSCPTVGRLQQVTKLKDPGDLVVVLVPRGNSMRLKALALEIRAGEKVVWTQELKLMDQEKRYSPIVGSSKAIRGYAFALDQDAMRRAEKLFVPNNTIGIKAEVDAEKGGGTATFYLVNAKSILPAAPSK